MVGEKSHLSSLVRDRRGVSSVEYALLLIAILLVGAGAYRLLGQHGATAANKAEATLLGQNPTSNPGNGGGGGGGSPIGVVCDGRSCSAPGQCFVSGTPVATASGERPIEDLAAGEIVLTRSEHDGAVEARPIVHTFARLAPSLVDVHVVTLDGARERVRSTPEHLYYTYDRGWLGAADLHAGEALMDRAGREAQVTKVVSIAQEAVVYNLEVDTDHTYFVGHSALWVHNQCDGNTTTTGGATPATSGSGAATPPPATGPVLGGYTPETLPDDQKNAIYKYTQGWYMNYNQALRKGSTRFSDKINLINQGLANLPDYQGNVYRGTTLTPDQLAAYQVGARVSDPAFTSTSTDPNVTNKPQFNGNVKFTIESKHGKYIAPISMHPDEQEVLFPPGTNFKVTGVQQNGKYTNITLEEV